MPLTPIIRFKTHKWEPENWPVTGVLCDTCHKPEATCSLTQADAFGEHTWTRCRDHLPGWAMAWYDDLCAKQKVMRAEEDKTGQSVLGPNAHKLFPTPKKG